MELSLDIQVDPATKKILSNPEKCKSALLDVTIVKPTAEQQEMTANTKTTTLRADQVRKMIASLEKERRENQKLLDHIKTGNTLVKIRKHSDPVQKILKQKTRIESSSPVDDLERKDFIGIGESVEPLFCEIRRSLKNVETRITNMQDINLVISQSTVEASTSEEFTFYKTKPASTTHHHIPSNTSLVYRSTQNGLIPDLKSVLRCQKEKKKDEKTEGKCMCENCGIVGLLMECQRHPLLNELREAPPPEVIRSRKPAKVSKTPKDDQLVHIQLLSKRIKQLEQRLAEQELNSVPKDYFNRIVSKIQPKQQSSEYSLSSNNKSPRKPRLANSTDNVRCFRHSLKSNLFHKNHPVKHEATTTEEDIHVWRWGEEILRPGIDLKNRILNLVTDILSKFVITEKPSGTKMTPLTPEGRRSSPVTVKHYGLRSASPPKANNPYANRKPAFRDNKRKCEEQMSKECYNLDVSYVNPKMSSWKNDDFGTAKEEFYKVISKAKASQKEVLWRNIWNQAKANGQTKDDKITIKIPKSGNNGNKSEMFETELSIREVEEILTKEL